MTTAKPLLKNTFLPERHAGVLLHPTSLPSGCLDEEAWKFVDWMVEANLTVWQMLPLTQPVEGLSPYQSVSTYALNPALLPKNWEEQVDEVSFKYFLENPPHWLDDYALFMALREKNDLKSWSEWSDRYKFRDEATLIAFKFNYLDQINFLKKQQFALLTIWRELKEYANQRGVMLFGDLPIFVAYDSADVWVNPQDFKLDEKLNPTVVAGVPPDYFSATGQRWGNPHYDWRYMQESDFEWWKKRIEYKLDLFDLIRIDHFRGLEACWEIDQDEETAMNGRWVEVPGDELLGSIQQSHPNLPLVAEDLGIITEEVVALKEKYNLPGMSILQFGFNGLPDNPHSLAEQVNNSVVYTGTHDNDTSRGWWEGLDDDSQKNWIYSQLNNEIGEMPWPLIHAAFQSPAVLAIIPMQDFLMLNNQCRMNVPGTIEGNWLWKFEDGDLTEGLATKIVKLVELSHRNTHQ